MNSTPTTEDRIWAVFSHLSVLAFGMGIPLPIVGWSEQRRKSNYASFQCLQALGYQSLGFTVWVLSYFVMIIVISASVLAVLGSRAGSRENLDAALGPWMIGIFTVVFGFFALYFLLPIIAVVACALGRDFRYPIMGVRLARYLGYDPARTVEEQTWLIEGREFRWVAAMGHFSILILLWGMLAPLVAWILQGRRSSFLKFQSLQTIVYQAGTTLLYFVVLFLYGIGLFALIASTGLTSQLETGSALEIFGILIFGVSLLLALVIALVVPVLHIFGQWAGYRLLKGDDYHYPFVGRLVDKWISRNSATEEKLA